MQRPCSGAKAFWIKSTANLDYETMKQRSKSPSQQKVLDDTYGVGGSEPSGEIPDG